MGEITRFIEEYTLRYVHYGSLDFQSRYERNDDADNIDHSLRLIYDTFRSCNIPVQEDSSINDEKCVGAYKCLLLTTKFKCHRPLKKEALYGHMLRKCLPKMYPYMLTEIVWYLGYEGILAASLLYMPLDLCNEILKIVRKTIRQLEFERGLNFLVEIIVNCRKNLTDACDNGKQSKNVEASCDQLLKLLKKFIALFLDAKFLRMREVRGLKKYERIGFVIRSLIALTQRFLSETVKEVLPEVAPSYILKFREDRLWRDFRDHGEQIRNFNQKLITILKKKLDEVDRECFQKWGMLDADGQPSTTLQRAIRNDLYHFVRFLPAHREVVNTDRLIRCIETFDPKPAPTFPTINPDNSQAGSFRLGPDSIKPLMLHYRVWIHDSFYFIRKHRALLDMEDIGRLIEYLELIFRKPGNEYFKNQVCVTIRKALFQHHVIANADEESDDASNEEIAADNLDCLNPAWSVDNFMKHISLNKGYLKSLENLWATLSFFLLNTRDIVGILIKIMTGVVDDKRFWVHPKHLIFFNPAIKIGGSDMRLVLNEILITVITCENVNEEKLIKLVNLMLKAHVFTADEFINYVFTPWLRHKNKLVSNVVPVLKCVLELRYACSQRINIVEIITAIARTLSEYRRDLLLPRTISDEIIWLLREAAEEFLKRFWMMTLIQYNTANVLVKNTDLLRLLEPIDRYKEPFALLRPFFTYYRASDWYMSNDMKDSFMGGFGKALLKRKRYTRIDPKAPTKRADLYHLHNDFVRYKLIESSERELFEYADSLVWKCFRQCGFTEECAAFDYFLTVCMETAVYFLQLPAANPPESFACLMRSLAKFTSKLANDVLDACQPICTPKNFNRLQKMYGFHTTLRHHFWNLRNYIQHTVFYPMYQSMIESMYDSSFNSQPDDVVFYQIVAAMEQFADKCFEIPHSQVRYGVEPCEVILKFKKSHDFIHACLNADVDNNPDRGLYRSLCATFRELLPIART